MNFASARPNLTRALTLICFRGCSGVSLGSAMSSTNCTQQRYNSSIPGHESSSTWVEAGRRRSEPPSASSSGAEGRSPVCVPWSCKQGCLRQGWARHRRLRLPPSPKRPGCGSGGGGRRAGSGGRPPASSDARTGSLMGPRGCGSGAGVLESHRWGCRGQKGIPD